MDGEVGLGPKRTPETPATPRSLLIATFLATLLVSAAAGSFIFRRYRRAAAWLAVDFGLLGLFGALAPSSPRAMWGALAALCLLHLVAAIDAVRIARIETRLAPISRVVAAWACASLLAFGAAHWLKATRIEAFKIPSGAMMPTLLVGDHVMADKRSRPIERGDVIVFRYPPDPSVVYAKRVVAIGGDFVESRPRELTVNGKRVPATQLPGTCPREEQPGGDYATDDRCELWEETLDGKRYTIMTGGAARASRPMQVPAGEVFVLGDNRDNSSDSRIWGTVPSELIVGRVAYVWYSRGPEGVRWDRVNKVVR